MLSQQGNLFCPALVIIGSFQNKRKLSKGRVIDNSHESLKADGSLSDTGMAILMASLQVHAVIDMNGLKPGHSEGLIKFLQHAF